MTEINNNQNEYPPLAVIVNSDYEQTKKLTEMEFSTNMCRNPVSIKMENRMEGLFLFVRDEMDEVHELKIEGREGRTVFMYMKDKEEVMMYWWSSSEEDKEPRAGMIPFEG